MQLPIWCTTSIALWRWRIWWRRCCLQSTTTMAGLCWPSSSASSPILKNHLQLIHVSVSDFGLNFGGPTYTRSNLYVSIYGTLEWSQVTSVLLCVCPSFRLFLVCFQVVSSICLELAATYSSDRQLSVFKLRLNLKLFTRPFTEHWHNLPPASLKLRTHGTIQILLLLLLLLLLCIAAARSPQVRISKENFAFSGDPPHEGCDALKLRSLLARNIVYRCHLKSFIQIQLELVETFCVQTTDSVIDIAYGPTTSVPCSRVIEGDNCNECVCFCRSSWC